MFKLLCFLPSLSRAKILRFSFFVDSTENSIAEIQDRLLASELQCELN